MNHLFRAPPRRESTPMPTRASRLLAVFVLLLVAAAQAASGGEAFASARPGGGGSFSHGSGSSSSGGSRSGSGSSGRRSSGFGHSGSSSGDSSFGSGPSSGRSSSSRATSPVASSSSSPSRVGTSLGVPLLCLLGIVVVLGLVFRSPSSHTSWSTHTPSWPLPPPPPTTGDARRRLLALRLHDPNFSLVLFDDFLVALYTEIKMAQGRGQLARYQPYLSSQALSALGPPGGEITTVIVGSASIEDVAGLEPSSTRALVRVVFEANYAVHHAQGETARYVREEWSLSRQRDARSRTPDNARVIGCPNCGGPLDVVVAGVCGHCRADVTGGNFDWVVQTIEGVAAETRGPMLTSDVEERGNELPTVVNPGAATQFAALEATDPENTWRAFSGRVDLVFTAFQSAWAARELGTMRPFMSDALFSTQAFWVAEYRRQGLRNITEDARIERLELANVTQDAFFDAVTVRVHASSLDYTVRDANGLLVCGSKTKPRRYTEYWTFIRGRGRRGAPRLDRSCPNCGAPLAVSMAGDCNHCRVKVTTGEFDWVLSRIEQDEVYRG